jgi:hypothetical protein
LVGAFGIWNATYDVINNRFVNAADLGMPPNTTSFDQIQVTACAAPVVGPLVHAPAAGPRASFSLAALLASAGILALSSRRLRRREAQS